MVVVPGTGLILEASRSEGWMSKSQNETQQLDLFVATLVDLPLRDQRETMERPFFSLS